MGAQKMSECQGVTTKATNTMPESKVQVVGPLL